jgi:hypothetical protein
MSSTLIDMKSKGADLLVEPSEGPRPMFFVGALGGLAIEIIQYLEGVESVAKALGSG